MCGIAGIFYFRPGANGVEAIERMSAALAHRGPDEHAFYSGPNVRFAHRRLKIIDLSPEAAQPMHDEAGRYQVMFNGEIYNFRELRKQLESKYRFFSRSDTEVILRLFQEHHQQTWELLRGMFAIALYDSSAQELFLARDAAGIKPLYCYQDDSRLIFASELKAIAASRIVELEKDPASLERYLRWGYFPRDTTPYKRCFKLLPGEALRVSAFGIERTRFWNLRSFTVKPSTPGGALETLDQLLHRSVEGHMISDVPLGAFLSGGIDSSLLVALMSSKSEAPVKTFTVGFSKMGYYDERAEAARVAKLFGTEHHEFVVDEGVAELVPKLAAVFDEPFADSSAVPTLCLAELARPHVTVALSGTGGDEIFGGYRKYMASYWTQWYSALPQGLRSGLQKTASLLPASRQSLWGERALLLQRFASLPTQVRPEIQLNVVFSEAELSRMLGANKSEPAVEEFLPLNGTAAENLMLFDCEMYLPEDLLVKEDRCMMRFGLEARVPYLDRDIIEFMSSLPIRYKVTALSTKRLFKKVAAKYLPEWVLQRPKHGFGSPVAEWLRKDLKDLAHDLLLHPAAYVGGSFTSEKLDAHVQGKSDYSRQLWTLLMLELWHAQNRAD